MKKAIILYSVFLVFSLFLPIYLCQENVSASVLLDDFNRADGQIGAEWTEVNGTFLVVDNKIQGGFVALATFNGSTSDTLEGDVAVTGTYLEYTGLVLRYKDIDNNYFIKVQQSSKSDKFNTAAFYYGNNGGGGRFFMLKKTFSTAHMKVTVVGKKVTLTFSNIDGGASTQTYTHTYSLDTGGDGIGICGFNNKERMDNFTRGD